MVISMGKRDSWALTEEEVVKLRSELSNQDNNNKYVFDILVYTGIRESDWRYLAKSWNETKTRWIDVYIKKQSNTSKSPNKVVKRHIMMPELTFNALQQKEYELKELSESAIKKYVKSIQDTAFTIGINRPISPHDLRATFINLLKHRGYDIFDIQNITQHSSLTSLVRYFTRDTDVVKQAFETLRHDRYDSMHPKLLAKENNRLKDEIAILRAQLKSYEQKNNSSIEEGLTEVFNGFFGGKK